MDIRRLARSAIGQRYGSPQRTSWFLPLAGVVAITVVALLTHSGRWTWLVSAIYIALTVVIQRSTGASGKRNRQRQARGGERRQAEILTGRRTESVRLSAASFPVRQDGGDSFHHWRWSRLVGRPVIYNTPHTLSTEGRHKWSSGAVLTGFFLALVVLAALRLFTNADRGPRSYLTIVVPGVFLGYWIWRSHSNRRG